MRAMKSVLIVTSLLAVGAPRARAEDPWRPLFNGRDLAGWQVVGEDQNGWTVTDGILHPSGAGGWLSTEEQFADFELRLEFRLPPGGNSGVFLRAPHEGRISRTGMEIQLLDDFTDVYGKLEDWQLTGSIYHVCAALKGAVKKPGDWQEMAITARGRKVRIDLNGKTVVDANLDDYHQLDEEHPGLLRERGYIGLQNYGGRGNRKVEFRNVRIRELGAG